jgi:hypothetical protein
MEALIITNSIREVDELHTLMQEPDWYKETYKGQYPVGPHIHYDSEWVWYYNGRKSDTCGQSGMWSMKNMVERHPGIRVYTLEQYKAKG